MRQSWTKTLDHWAETWNWMPRFCSRRFCGWNDTKDSESVHNWVNGLLSRHQCPIKTLPGMFLWLATRWTILKSQDMGAQRPATVWTKLTLLKLALSAGSALVAESTSTPFTSHSCLITTVLASCKNTRHPVGGAPQAARSHWQMNQTVNIQHVWYWFSQNRGGSDSPRTSRILELTPQTWGLSGQKLRCDWPLIRPRPLWLLGSKSDPELSLSSWRVQPALNRQMVPDSEMQTSHQEQRSVAASGKGAATSRLWPHHAVT